MGYALHSACFENVFENNKIYNIVHSCVRLAFGQFVGVFSCVVALMCVCVVFGVYVHVFLG